MTYVWRRNVGKQPILASAGTVQLVGNERKPVRRSFVKQVPKGQYDVRIRRTTPDSTSDRETTETNLLAMRFTQDQAFDSAGQTRVDMMVKATGQLNGTVDQFSAIVSAKTVGIENTLKWVTMNPAWWFLAVLRGVYHPTTGRLIAGMGLPDTKIDLDSINAWAAFCDANNLWFGAVFDQKSTSVAEALTRIAKVGRASFTYASGKIGVVWDAPNQAPVALFGPHNILPGTFNVNYSSEKVVDEIVVRYMNKDNNWQQDTVRVLVPGGNNPPQSAAEIDLFGVVFKAQAAEEANLLAAAQVWRRRRISWETDMEGLLVNRGDVVIMSHDLTAWGASGRVFAATSTTSITLDKPVTGNGAIQWLAFRRPDNASITYHQVAAFSGEQETITLIDPLPIQPGSDGVHVTADYVWTFGPTATPGKKLKIIGIEPSDDLRVRIVATDENPEYYASKSGVYTDNTSSIVIGTAPEISGLKITSLPSSTADGADLQGVATWEVTGATYTEAHVYTQDMSHIYTAGVTVPQPFVFRGSTRGRSFEFSATPDKPYNVMVVVFGELGTLGPSNKQVVTWFAAPPNSPSVTGLASATGSTTLTRDDMRIVWDAQPYAKQYKITITATGPTLNKVIEQTETSFTYRYEDALADGGPWRSITFSVQAGTEIGYTGTPATITLTNAAPAAPGVTLTPGVKSIQIDTTLPADADFAGMLVYGSQTAGFTAGPANLLADVNGNSWTHENINGTWYYRIAHYDTWGKTLAGLNQTAQVTTTSLGTGITGYLTNEATVVAANSSGVVSDWSPAAGFFKVFDGSTDVTNSATFSVVSGSATGGLTAPIDNTTTKGSFAASALTAQAGTITYRAVYNGVTIDKVFTVSKAIAGAAGSSTFRALRLSGTSQVFQIPKNGGAASPSSIVLTSTLVNVTGTTTFTVVSGTATLTSVTSSSATVLFSNMSTDSVVIRARVTDASIDYDDYITLVKVREGDDTLTGFLTNESHVVPALYDGSSPVLTGAVGVFKVYLGSTDVTTSATFAAGATTGSLVAGISDTVGSKGQYACTILGSDAATIEYSATYGGRTITKVFSVSKSKQGTAGNPGVNGTRTAVLDLYQWASSAPTLFPSGSSTYTWATGQFTAPAALNGWSLTPGSGAAGQTLYICRQVYSDTNTSATSVVTWSASTALPVGAAGTNGNNGVNGQRVGVLELYRWSASAPTTYPSGTSTYTWATGAFTAPTTPNGWLLLPGAAVAGQTLWGISVVVSDNLTTATSTANWTSSTVYAVGAAGSNGSPGANAVSGFLTNESHGVPTDASGAILSYSGSGGSFQVYDGTTNITTGSGVVYSKSGAFSGLSSLSVATIDSSGNYAISSGITADVAWVDFTATYGAAVITKRFTVTKMKQGLQGQSGSNGNNGTRGSLLGYRSGVTPWPSGGSSTSANNIANAVILDMANGNAPGTTTSTTATGHLIRGDTVVLSSSSASETRVWDGSAWADPGEIVDGNKIVAGTVNANRITAGTLTANMIAAGTLAVGVVYSGTINTSQINAGTLNAGVVYAGDINASQITAGTLTGRTIQTAASGARLILNEAGFANQLRGYSAGGALQFILGASTGTLYMDSDTTGIVGRFISSAGTHALKGEISSGSGIGVEGSAVSGAGVKGQSGSGPGAQFLGNATRGNINIPALGSLPSSPQAGDIIFYNGKLCFYNGSAWYTAASWTTSL